MARGNYFRKRFDYFTALWCHAGTVAIGSLTHTFTDGPYRFLSTMERLAVSKATGDGTALDRQIGTAAICFMDWVTLPCAENCLK